jgi:hypothetical protein
LQATAAACNVGKEWLAMQDKDENWIITLANVT